jgi:TonB family protein
MMKVRVLISTWALLICASPAQTHGQTSLPRIKLAVLDFGKAPLGRSAADKLATSLGAGVSVALVDRDLTRAAAKGAGYSDSLNMSLAESRDLGAALGSDFFIIGDAETLRRSQSSLPVYFESYASIFLVSARTGRLVIWRRPSVKADRPETAEHSLLAQLQSDDTRVQLAAAIQQAHEAERYARALPLDPKTPIIEAAPDDEKKAEAEGLRLPRPFRRLIPAYTASAEEAEAEATIDVIVDINAKGDVTRVEVARWGGFGLDESTVSTVQKINFFPAMRDGVAVPLRVLLRYNFRKPKMNNVN